jgi:predicted RNA-binding Zn-ribbon protein involved in translation (DUF1610 family)
VKVKVSASASASAKATARQAPLWKCPKCGLKFIGRNMAHSCLRATLGDWQRRMGPKARRLYDRFETLVARCGEYYVSPAKTRITFMGRIRFAGITRIDEDGMTCNFALARPVDVTEVVPGWWVHRLKITDPAELDAQVERWIQRSYRTMGTHGRAPARTARR